jgi:hypothetical protein
LNVPIAYGGVVVGHLVAFSDEPWSRHQISRARMLCYQLGAPVRSYALR